MIQSNIQVKSQGATVQCYDKVFCRCQQAGYYGICVMDRMYYMYSILTNKQSDVRVILMFIS